MKKLVYGIMILGVLVGGLFAIFEDKVSVDIPEDVILNLEERYGGSFKFIDYIPEENTENSRVMKIKGKDGEFKLTRYYDGNNQLHYNDNYLGVKYKDKLEDTFEEYLERVNKKVNFELDLGKSTFPDETTKKTFYPNLLSSEETFFELKVVSGYEWTDGDIEYFSYRMKEQSIKVNVTMLYCEDSLIKLSDFDSVIRSDESVGKRLSFSIGEDGSILYINRS